MKTHLCFVLYCLWSCLAVLSGYFCLCRQRSLLAGLEYSMKSLGMKLDQLNVRQVPYLSSVLSLQLQESFFTWLHLGHCEDPLFWGLGEGWRHTQRFSSFTTGFALKTTPGKVHLESQSSNSVTCKAIPYPRNYYFGPSKSPLSNELFCFTFESNLFLSYMCVCWVYFYNSLHLST